MKGIDDFKKKLVIDGKSPSDASENKEHGALLRDTKRLIDQSRKEMSKHYSAWDYYDQVFRSRRVVDKEDRAANAKGQPAKLIVPLQFSQVLTFVAYAVMSVTQNRRFFGLDPQKAEEHPLREATEQLLQRDCNRNDWTSFLIQYFLDLAKFGISAAEVCWKEEVRKVRMTKESPVAGAFGTTGTETTQDYVDIPTFVGNKVYPISPYRIYPDTNLPLTRYQEGEFCGSEDMFSYASLLADSENLFNLDKIPKMTLEEFNERRKSSRIDVMEFMPTRTQAGNDIDTNSSDGFVRSGPVVVTKVVRDIIPSKFQLDGDNVLGKEDFPIRYIVWYANDKVIIRFEEATYLHFQFPYAISQFLPDQHKTLNEGLSDVADQITNTITWLINAATTMKRSSLDGKFIVDPAGVDIRTLESRSPYIFLKKNMANTGVDRYIKQFQQTDTTNNYMQEAKDLKDLLENCTGVSAQMQGQYSDGRRSATQDRVVAQGASSRGKLSVATAWEKGFQQIGKQFLANNRQEMDIETFVRVLGAGPFGEMKDIPVDQLFLAFKGDPVSIATSEDFFFFDNTMPSEKAFLAQNLQEIVMTVLQNPEVAMSLGYGPAQVREMFNDLYELRGVTPPSLPATIPPQPQPNVLPMQPPGQSPAATAPPAALPAVSNG